MVANRNRVIFHSHKVSGDDARAAQGRSIFRPSAIVVNYPAISALPKRALPQHYRYVT